MEVYDFEIERDESGNITLTLNQFALEDLIEKLEYIRDSPVMTSHVHIDEVSGLAGNVKSILIMKRQQPKT